MKEKIKYVSIKIPESLAKILEREVEKSKGIFTSKTDLIKYEILSKYYGGIEDEKRDSIARIDGGQDNAPGNGLAESKDTSEGTDKGSQVDAGIKQLHLGKSGEGTQNNLGGNV